MASPTTNKGYTYDTHGGGVNAWDTPLNADFDQIDLNVAGYYPVAVSTTITGSSFQSSVGTIGTTTVTATPSASIAQNLTYRFTGTMGASLSFVLPTAGGFYIIDNQLTSTGYTLKVNTAVGSSGTTIPSGGSNLVYTSTVASNPATIVGQFAAKMFTSTGTPGTAISTATAGSVAGSFTDMVWDGTAKQLYACVTTGASTSAVFIQTIDRPQPQGYLTLSTDTANIMISSDYSAKAAVYYSPLYGGWSVLSNGTALYPYQFSQLSLALTTGAHVADTIYDVFLYNSTAGVMIGTGPAWTNSAGGTGARGSGAGTSELTRLSGALVNANSATVRSGSTTFTCPAAEGIYLGSILIDPTAGQVSNYLSYGTNRKWGVWNYYNRQDIYLKAGVVSTVPYSFPSGTAVQIPTSTGNSLQIFCGVAEERLWTCYTQAMNVEGFDAFQWVGVGINSTNVFSGRAGSWATYVSSIGLDYTAATVDGEYVFGPSLGMNVVYALGQNEDSSPEFGQGELEMTLVAKWRG